MEGIAEKKHTERWAEKTPEHLLYAPEIKKTIPDALFLHIIRDGRDVACSMGRLGFCPPFPWDRGHETLVAGLYWEWLLRHGRHIAQSVGRDYIDRPWRRSHSQ